MHSKTGTIIGGSEFLGAPFGLFPHPSQMKHCVLNESQYSNAFKKLLFLGNFVAKAIKDGRIMGIPFFHSFYKVILKKFS